MLTGSTEAQWAGPRKCPPPVDIEVRSTTVLIFLLTVRSTAVLIFLHLVRSTTVVLFLHLVRSTTVVIFFYTRLGTPLC